MTDFINNLKIDGAFQSKCVTTDNLVFGDYVRKMCEANTCGRYKKSWTCPPYVGTPDELYKKVTSFKNALVFTYVGDLEDSFDIDGMDAARESAKTLLETVIEKFKRKNIPYMPLGGGSCTNCKECTCPDSPCRFPEKAVVSVEACGVDVVKTSQKIGLNYYNGANTVTYFNIILF